MNYKYRRNQIFGKRLKVPKEIKSKVYGGYLSFQEFLQYQLEDKVPISCLQEKDRKIVEKFGIEKTKRLDWEFLKTVSRYRYLYAVQELLMKIDPNIEDINAELYESFQHIIKPSDYSSRMKEIYPDRLFENSDSIKKKNFNNGNVSLEELIRDWELYQSKDLYYCLLNDKKNTDYITDRELKKFMLHYGNIAKILLKYDENINIYSFIHEINALTNDVERKEYIKQFTDHILEEVKLSNDTNFRYSAKYSYIIENILNEEYEELFQYSSLKNYLREINSYYADDVLKELKHLPRNYVFHTSVPFSTFCDYDVMNFIGVYGLKNVVDFDNECGHFFTKNNCQMLKLMNDMYLHYGRNEHNPNKTIYTRNSYDENGNYVDRPYTKDEFYEAMKRMIIYGPTDTNYVDKAPDYRNMIGEFRVRNAQLFISKQAPEELQKLFYTKNITPQLLVEHPEYIPYLNGKDLGSCFRLRLIQVEDSNALYGYENLYNFIREKTDFNGTMSFITEYSDVFNLVFDRSMTDSYQYEIKFSKEDHIDEMQKRINESFKKLIIEKRIVYPKNIPQSLIAQYPLMFLSSNSPKELQEAFYNRTINSEFILSNPSYKEYLKNVELEILFRYMPVDVVSEEHKYSQVNLVSVIKEKFGSEDGFDIMLLYEKYIESVFEANKLQYFKFNPNFSKDGLLDELDNTILQTIIDGNMKYNENIPSHFKNNNPTLFLSQNVPQNIRDKFYNREFTLNDFNANPELLEMFGNTNIVCGFSEDFSWMISLFNDLDDLKMANYNRLKVISAYSMINDVDFKRSFEKYIKAHILDLDTTYIIDLSELLNTFTNFEKLEYNILNNQEKVHNEIFKHLIEIFSYSTCSWIIDIFNKNDLKSTLNTFKVISLYKNIQVQDVALQNAFKEYIIEFGNSIDIEKIEYVSEILLRLSLSNSSEIFAFRNVLATQILKSVNPIESLNKIEDVFIRNNIPTVGKTYSCFEILHPNFQWFDFEYSMISPVLKNASTKGKEAIVFADLIKASMGSNNLSVNAYLKNIEIGSKLYESIKTGQIQYDSLDEAQKDELIIFSRHLATLYNNTMRGKNENETFTTTEDVLTDILELTKKLSPDGSLDYNLSDRIIRMFCGVAGINTLEEAKTYVKQKVKLADTRNRKTAESDLILEKGDFVKGIGDITYLRNILQNGSVSKEYLGSNADSDSTPLDTDVSMIMNSDGTVKEKIDKTAAKGYGPIWFALKNDDRFFTTRTKDGDIDTKNDMSKIEVFHTGVLGEDHYGIRTGFASSEINSIIMKEYDPRVGLEIAMNGFYIPVANMEGKIVFTPEDYDRLREKMNGLSYYGMGEYQFDSSIYSVNSELTSILSDIDSNKKETKNKADLIYSSLSKKLKKLNLSLTDKIDLENDSVTLLNTGSTGRFTNLPGDGDFDFIMQVDRSIFVNSDKMNRLREAIIRAFETENRPDIVNGDIREFKTKVVDDQGIEHEVEIDITFVTKTDKTEYASDVCVSDRLNSIATEEKRNLVKSNIILAKKLLKGLNAYKPARKDNNQGGMGGIGVENWILQNGGTLYRAAKSFIECANQCENFDEFRSKYKLYNFGINHMAEKKGFYPHDDYIENMNATGYEKMKKGLTLFLNLYNSNVQDPCMETIKKMKEKFFSLNNVIDKYQYDNEQEIMGDTQRIIQANLQNDIIIEQTNMGQTGFMYEFFYEGKEYLAKAGVNKNNRKVNPARATVQKAASVLQKMISPDTCIEVKTFGLGRFRVAVQEKIKGAKMIDINQLIKEHTNELLGEYICDYLLGNYDSDSSNFIIDSNQRLHGIDKEQSFKYLLDDNFEQSLSLDFSFQPAGSRSNIYPALIQHLKQVGLTEENLDFFNRILMNLQSISDFEYQNIFKNYAYVYDSNRADEILSRILLRKKYLETHLNTFIQQINRVHEQKKRI